VVIIQADVFKRSIFPIKNANRTKNID